MKEKQTENKMKQQKVLRLYNIFKRNLIKVPKMAIQRESAYSKKKKKKK